MRNTVEQNEGGLVESGARKISRRGALLSLRDMAAGAVCFALVPGCKDDEPELEKRSEFEPQKPKRKRLGSIKKLDQKEFLALCSTELLVSGVPHDDPDAQKVRYFQINDSNFEQGPDGEPHHNPHHRDVLEYKLGEGDLYRTDVPAMGLSVGHVLTFERAIEVDMDFDENGFKPSKRINFAGYTVKRGEGENRYQMSFEEIRGENYLVLTIRGEKFISPTPYEELRKHAQKLTFVRNLEVHDPNKATNVPTDRDRIHPDVRDVERKMLDNRRVKLPFHEELTIQADGQLSPESLTRLATLIAKAFRMKKYEVTKDTDENGVNQTIIQAPWDDSRQQRFHYNNKRAVISFDNGKLTVELDFAYGHPQKEILEFAADENPLKLRLNRYRGKNIDLERGLSRTYGRNYTEEDVRIFYHQKEEGGRYRRYSIRYDAAGDLIDVSVLYNDWVTLFTKRDFHELTFSKHEE